MTTIQGWLDQEQIKNKVDFLGIAMNTQKEHQLKEIRWRYVVGNLNENYKKIQLQVGRGLAGIVWKTARLQIDQSISSNTEKMIAYPIARLEQLESAMAIPIVMNQIVEAVFLIAFREVHQFSIEEQSHFLAVSEELKVLLKEMDK